MKSYIQDHILFPKLRLSIVFFLVFFNVSSILAQVGTVNALYYNGQPKESLNLKFFGLKSGADKIITVTKGFRLSSGDKIEIPAGCGIQFYSPRGWQNVFSTSGKPIIYSVKFKGNNEEHIINGKGQIQNTVTVAGQLGASYKVGNGAGISASSKSTIYTFTNFEDNNQASLKTDEGQIEIIEEVTMQINDYSQKINDNGPKSEKQKYPTKSISNTQTAGNANTFGGRKVVYNNFNDALNGLAQEINYQRQTNADPEELMDNYAALGELQMDLGNAANAIESFKGALYYCNLEYYEDEMESIEIQLYLAEAYMDNGNQNESVGIVNRCLTLLQDNLKYDKEDLYYAQDDQELRQLICEDILDIYDFLGWAYEIVGYTAESDQYYSAGCQ